MAGTYTTILGDTWDVIALKTLGDEKYTGKLIESNIELADTVFFSAGIVIHIPEISVEEAATLPPWKRGG